MSVTVRESRTPTRTIQVRIRNNIRHKPTNNKNINITPLTIDQKGLEKLLKSPTQTKPLDQITSRTAY